MTRDTLTHLTVTTGAGSARPTQKEHTMTRASIRRTPVDSFAVEIRSLDLADDEEVVLYTRRLSLDYYVVRTGPHHQVGLLHDLASEYLLTLRPQAGDVIAAAGDATIRLRNDGTVTIVCETARATRPGENPFRGYGVRVLYGLLYSAGLGDDSWSPPPSMDILADRIAEQIEVRELEGLTRRDGWLSEGPSPWVFAPVELADATDQDDPAVVLRPGLAEQRGNYRVTVDGSLIALAPSAPATRPAPRGPCR